MKAVVIENDYSADPVIKGFLKDNPTLFESVEVMSYARDRGHESILSKIIQADAIIVASMATVKLVTWKN